jgi:hypothetical protein
MAAVQLVVPAPLVAEPTERFNEFSVMLVLGLIDRPWAERAEYRASTIAYRANYRVAIAGKTTAMTRASVPTSMRTGPASKAQHPARERPSIVAPSMAQM